jgi:DNA primase
MNGEQVDFQRIKEISMRRVLARYGVKLRSSGSEMRGQCPLPAHTSRESRNSFSVNLARNIWCCQSMSCTDARAGQLGGTVLDFVAEMEHCSIREAALHLADWFGGLESVPHIVEQKPRSYSEPNLPLKFQLTNLDYAHSYLDKRGITPATARSLGIGYYSGPGIMQGRVVIPIRNSAHELVAYAGRSIDGEEPKYRFPAGFHKSLELFQLHRARHAGADTVIIVEGLFDAAKVWQAGNRNVVALMGSSLSETQAGHLQKHFRSAVLMLDGDVAGQKATAVITGRLSQAMDVTTIRLPEGRQPDQLASREINEIVSVHVREAHGYGR